MTQLTGLSEKVFLDRYSLKDEAGNPVETTPEEMWKRVARGIADVETKENKAIWRKKFYDVMKDFKFLPGGRIFAGAGTNYDVTYYNCFVIPSPKDSRDGILDNLKSMIEIMARGGGVGLNLSSLRPRGARVKKVNGFSSGPINWAELYSLATKDIVQQGGSRRGALMLMLHDWHPDIEEFITVKQDLTRINGANLSVCLSDAFMEAVKNNADWDLAYPDLDDPMYDEKWDGDLAGWKKIGGRVKVQKTIKASYLWDLICTAAWRSAEPGLHFLERSNKRSNTWYFEKLIATNPCGEQPLSAWAVCNLGAMNLTAYVKEGKFDYDSFGADVQVATRFLDNVIDSTYYFLKENEQCAKDIRRTGLGIMGLGDALIMMKLRYGAEESLPTIDKIFKTLRDNAYIASTDIAKEKGAFPKFEAEKYLQGHHIKALPKSIRERIEKNGIRNAVLLTIAPTGTTSLLAGTTSGIEPVYEFEFIRKSRLGIDKLYHPLYDEWRKQNPDVKRPEYFVSANDLTPMDHAKVQAIAQGYIDSSISKTVNAPNNHTVEDVKDLYMAAYDMGMKGITYMRDGSRMGVLQREEKKEEKKEEVIAPKAAPILRRPVVMRGLTYKTQTPLGDAFITINSDDNGNPFEVFVTIGKLGSDVAAMADALGRIISLTLRLQSPIEPRERIRQIIAQLSGIGGMRSVGFGQNRVRSVPDAMAKVFAEEFSFKVNGRVVDAPKMPIQADAMPAASESTTVSVSVAESSSSTNGNAAEAIKAANGAGTHGTMPSSLSDVYGQKTTVMDQPLQTEQLPLEADAAIETHSHADVCPQCGVASFVHEEGCSKCYSCGHAEC
ncbi:MAG: adenosylcobalamin-dependent ribonucleoside-diphosphate reductase [Candidatus Levybacteria bacterium]|nr:adenosylcobalamin-dependent ribonucleoside-diphosphate reductase [Candidatus Levybacteria bacterium]